MTAILPPHVDLRERVTLRCALGLRFRDPATNEIVRSGLRVEARRLTPGQPADARRTRAIVNASGVWSFHELRGACGFELGAEAAPVDRNHPPMPLQFRIEVEDEEGRFLRCAFTAAASLAGPNATERRLFSAPARSLPPGCATIRALIHTQRDQPAPWALVRAQVAAFPPALGLADHRGQMAMILPWPEPVNAARPATWPVQFAGWHRFDAEPGAFAEMDELLALPARAPDVLNAAAQPGGGLDTVFNQAPLQYGQPLIVPASQPRILIIKQA